MPKVPRQSSIAVGFSQRGHYFYNLQTGMEVYMPTHYPSSPLTIKENKFDSTQYGLVMAPEQNPLTDNTGINQATHLMNIRVTCNTFKYNNVGLIGSGNLRDQVHSDTAASNFFNFSGANSSMNENWDILWQEDPNGNAFAYVWDKSGIDYQPNNDSGLSKGIITLNGLSMNVTDHINEDISTNSICPKNARQYKRAASKNIQERTEASINIYPNPTQSEVHIALESPANGYFSLQNMAGKTVVQTAFQQKQTLTFETNHLASGVYFLRGRIEEKVVPPEKVVIMK